MTVRTGAIKARSIRAILLALCVIFGCSAPSWASYKVRKGDTLWEIARKHHVSVSNLARANKLTEKSILRPGMSLRIPGQRQAVNSRALRVTQTCKADAYTRVDSCILRAGPGTRHAKVASVKANTPVRIIGTCGPWRKVVLHGGAKGFIYAPLLTHVPMSAANAPRQEAAGFSSSPTQLVRTALACRGARYRRGGTSRGGFDCSGFTRYVYAQYGIRLPHSSSAQARVGVPVARDQLRAGDLVFFRTYRSGISHVGLYIGDGKFVHASNHRGGVRVDSLNHPYYVSRYRGARRVR